MSGVVILGLVKTADGSGVPACSVAVQVAGDQMDSPVDDTDVTDGLGRFRLEVVGVERTPSGAATVRVTVRDPDLQQLWTGDVDLVMRTGSLTDPVTVTLPTQASQHMAVRRPPALPDPPQPEVFAPRSRRSTDRDAPFDIVPSDPVVQLGDRTHFAVRGLSTSTVVRWAAFDRAGMPAPMSGTGAFAAAAAGLYTVRATADDASVQTSIQVEDFRSGRETPTVRAAVRVLPVGDADDWSPRWDDRSAARAAAPDNQMGGGGRTLLGDLREPWLGTRQSELREAATVGSGNFSMGVPILHLEGRGLDVDLELVYNSQLWQVIGGTAQFDVDHGWPAPGWNLGFGRLVRLGEQGSMIVEPDGTRHRFETVSLGGDWQRRWEFTGRTSDGSFIDYQHVDDFTGGFQFGEASYPDGRTVEYTARARPYRQPNTATLHPGWGTLYPTRITDVNGNYLTITYVDNCGPEIDTIVDTLGRSIVFHYDDSHQLCAISGPGLGDTRRNLLRCNLSRMRLDLADAFPALTVEPQPYLRSPWTFRAITLPDATGYWFGEPATYSAYGMLRRLPRHRNMVVGAVAADESAVIAAGVPMQVRTYDYPEQIDPSAADVPRYSTMTDWWEGVEGPAAVTQFAGQPTGDPRRTEIAYPTGTRTVTLAYNRPGRYDDGMVYRRETFAGTTRMEAVEQTWEPGDYGTARLARKRTETPNSTVVATEYSYGPYNRIAEIRDYDFGGAALLRRTRIDYHEAPGYIQQHLLRVPIVVEVFDRYETTPTARTEYSYDQQPLTDTPSVVAHAATHNPYAAATWIPPHDEVDCDPTRRPPCTRITIRGRWISEWNPLTRHRGLLTAVTRYANPGNRTGAVTELSAYDITGNRRRVDEGVHRHVRIDYSVDNAYGYPIREVHGAPTPGPDQLTVSTIRDAATGRIVGQVDADGASAVLTYDAITLRLATMTTGAGAVTTFTYTDAAATIETTRAADGQLLGRRTTTINGLGKVQLVGQLVTPATPSNAEINTEVRSRYDALGRLSAQTRPHVAGDQPDWVTANLDALGRLTAVISADNAETQFVFDEAQAPDDAPTPPGYGRTRRMIDPTGRQRWQLFDALGRLQIVVDPDPGGAGSVFDPGTAATFFAHDALDRVVNILQRPYNQNRTFEYDGLSRLVRLRVPERAAVLNDEGNYRGAGARWSDVYSYVDRFRPAWHTDPRGVRTSWDYGGDPLGRVQRIAYEITPSTTRPDPPPADTAPVTFTYADHGDPTRPATIRSAPVTADLTYDTTGRLVSETLTFDSHPRMPLRLGHGYDVLGRRTDLTYPEPQGLTGSPWTAIGTAYDLAGHPQLVTFDTGATVRCSYTPDGSAAAVIVTSGDDPIEETYDHDQATGKLTRQQVTRSGVTLLDLAYDYVDPEHGSTAGRLHQVSDNLIPDLSIDYGYDGMGRIHRAAGGPAGQRGWSQTYRHDRYGNPDVTAQGARPGGGLLPADGPTGLTYGQVGPTGFPRISNRITSPGYGYDEAGNLTRAQQPDGSWHRYRYDGAGRLVLIADDNGIAIQRRTYGACGRRLGYIDERTGVSVVTQWNGAQPVAEFKETGDGLTWFRLAAFLGDRLLVTATSAPAPAAPRPVGAHATTRWHHPGLNGNRLVTGPGSDDATPLVTLPYGTVLIGPDDGPVFDHYRRDAATSVDDAVNRDYASWLGRFLQPDPLGPLAPATGDPQNLNCYALSRGDPVNFTDPIGLRWRTVTGCVYIADGERNCTSMEVWVAEGADREIDPMTRQDRARERRDAGGDRRRGAGRELADVTMTMAGTTVLPDMLDSLQWMPSAWDSILGGLTAVGVGFSEIGGVAVTAIGAGTGAAITAAAGGVVGAGLAGWGVGTVLNRYMTAVMGETLGDFAYDMYEGIAEGISADLQTITERLAPHPWMR